MKKLMLTLLTLSLPIYALAAPSPVVQAPASSAALNTTYVHPALGLMIPAGASGLGEGFSNSIAVGHKFSPAAALKGRFHYSHLNTDMSDVSVNVMQILAGMDFFALDLPGLSFGIHSGGVIENSSSDSNKLRFGFGGSAGYEKMIARSISIGGEMGWTLVISKPKAYSLIGLLVPVRLYF